MKDRLSQWIQSNHKQPRKTLDELLTEQSAKWTKHLQQQSKTANVVVNNANNCNYGKPKLVKKGK